MQTKFIIGVILLTLSILFPLFKFEQLGVSIISQIKESKIYIEKSKIDNRASALLKDDISSLQKSMELSKNQLNELIQQSFELNEEINTLFRDSVLNKERADSINIMYTKMLKLNESNIDSVNINFNNQSDSLIDKINEFAYASTDIKIQKINNEQQKQLFVFNFFFIILYFLLMIFGIRISKNLMRNK